MSYRATPDLGARVEDNARPQHGIHLVVDGTPTRVQLNISQTGVHTIDYGDTATSTRMVVIAVSANGNAATSTPTPANLVSSEAVNVPNSQRTPQPTVLVNFYRPEKHYMRRPGPKSRPGQASVRSINEDV